jgi:FMN phosphatase YigB (HAD superfamily)
VLARLGVAAQFERIFDIVAMEFDCKPSVGAYDRVLTALGVIGEECMLVEDMARNLPTARGMGIQTILVLDPDALDQPSSWIPDPALEQRLRVCPPDANLCIREIYQVADAIQELAPAQAHSVEA